MCFPSSSLYQSLLSVYQSEPDNSLSTRLSVLPYPLRQQIFAEILTSNQYPWHLDDEERHVFDYLPLLQCAVSEIAENAFRSLPKGIIKDQIAWKIWDLAGKPVSEANWGKNHAADDIPRLLKIMHDSLGCLTPLDVNSLDSQILNLFSHLPSEECQAFLMTIVTFCKQLKIPEHDDTAPVLKAFRAIAQKEWTNVAEVTADLCKRLKITQSCQINQVLEAFGHIEQQERASVAEVTAHFCNQFNITPHIHVMQVLKAFSAIEQQERASVAEVTAHLCKRLKITPSFWICEVLAALCAIKQKERASVAEVTAHLYEQLNITDNQLNMTNAFDGMLHVLNAFCAIEQQERASVGQATAHVCDRSNMRDWRQIGRVLKVFGSIEQQERASLSQAIADLCNDLNITKDFQLFAIVESLQHFPPHLRDQVCRVIQNLPNERAEQKLLSPREESLLAISSSIQGCKAGKAEGIALAYNRLPLEGKLSHVQESDNPTVENALQQLDEIVLTILTDQCSSDNPMMHALTGEPKIKQLAHQALYVKNMIARWIGLPHVVQFDLHTEFLYDELIKKSLPELLDIFYQHLPVQRFIDALVDRSRQDDKFFFSSLNALLEEKLGKKVDFNDIWKLDEGNNPTLTKTGALQVWEAAGFISKVE